MVSAYGAVKPVHRKRATQPAKDNAISHNANQTDSWEIIQHNTEDVGHAPAYLAATNHLMDQINPLRDMANRVEREVDHFAETLDRFHSHLRGNDAYAAARDLAVEYKAFASGLVQKLKKRHEAQRLHDMKNEFGKRLGRSSDFGPAKRSSIVKASYGTDSGDLADDTSLDTLRQWQTEADTWELFRIMLELRYTPDTEELQREKQARLVSLDQPSRYTSDSALWERFTIDDDLAREKYLVLKWLQGAADHGESDIEAIAEELETKSGKGHAVWVNGWMETREKIKGVKRTRMLSTVHSTQLDVRRSDTSEPLVSELDPDAPSRQRRTLEKADAYSERSLWMTCFEMLRRGKSWAEICDWCSQRNQSWRAVSVGGSTDPAQDLPLPGLSAGVLWRRLCAELASKEGTDEYEAAVYGLLSGDLDSVKKVSKSWDDHVYASYNSTLLQRFDQYLLRKIPERATPSLVEHFQLLDSISTTATSRELVRGLREDPTVSAEAQRPLKQLQSSLITNNLDSFLLNLSTAISDAAWFQNQTKVITTVRTPASPDALAESAIVDDYDALRIITHMLIMLRDVCPTLSTKSANTEALDNIIAAYIQFLSYADKRELAPLYASKMSAPRAAISLAQVLSYVHDVQEKNEFIHLMRLYNIAPVSVLVEQTHHLIAQLESKREPGNAQLHIVENVAEDVTDSVYPGQRIKLDFTAQSLGGEGFADRHIVFSLIDGHWDITFETLATACRKLLLHGCFLEASRLVRTLPYETLSTRKSRSILQKGINVMDREEAQLLQGDNEQAAMLRVLQKQSQGYYDLSLLVRAVDALQSWRQIEHAHMNRASSSTAAPVKLKKAFEETCIAVELTLSGILLTAKDEAEAEDLAKIRTSLLPEVVLAYNITLCAGAHLVSRDSLMRSMELATLVADSRNGIADAILQAGRMREVVTSFARSSETMLKLNEIGKPRREKKHKIGGNLAVWEIGG